MTQQINRTKYHRGNMATYVIGGIAVAALLVAGIVLYQTDQGVASVITEGSREAASQTATAIDTTVEAVSGATVRVKRSSELAAVRAEARAELLTIKAQLEAGADYQNVAAPFNETQSELELAYVNASAQFDEEWKNIQQQLLATEVAIREETADALDITAELIAALESDMQTPSR